MFGTASYSDSLASFAALVEPAREDASIDVATAALAIARTEYPALDLAYYISRLDGLAKRVRSRMRNSPTTRETIALLNRVLFDEEGLRGNRENYYDPRNSFLNDVLDRKLGIPITLSVVYMDVARRVGFSLAGTGMPGHFLLKHYDVMSGEIIVDPFNRGRIVSTIECQQQIQYLDCLSQITLGEIDLAKVVQDADQDDRVPAASGRDLLRRNRNAARVFEPGHPS